MPNGTYEPVRKSKPRSQESSRIPKSALENALQVELNRKTDKPEPIGRIAKKLGWSFKYLQTHFPQLFDQLKARCNSYMQAQLESALLLDPPLSLKSIAKSIPYHRDDLMSIFPELCGAIIQQHRTCLELRKAANGKTLEAALTAPIPASICSIGKRLGISFAALQRQHPELYETVKTRYAEYIISRRMETETRARKQIRQAVFSLHTNGSPYPGMNKTFNSLPSNLDRRNPFKYDAYKEAIQDLR